MLLAIEFAEKSGIFVANHRTILRIFDVTGIVYFGGLMHCYTNYIVRPVCTYANTQNANI